MCLSKIDNVFDPPRQQPIKAYKVFEICNGKRFPLFNALVCRAFQLRLTSDCIATFRIASEGKNALPGWPENEWIEDKYQETIEADPTPEYLTDVKEYYSVGFHAFLDAKAAEAFCKKMNLIESHRQFALYEIEVDEVTAQGIQSYMVSALGMRNDPAVAARKMKIGREIPCA